MIKQGYQYVLCLQLFATAVIHGTDKGGNIQEKPETESSEAIHVVLAKSKLEKCVTLHKLNFKTGCNKRCFSPIIGPYFFFNCP